MRGTFAASVSHVVSRVSREIRSRAKKNTASGHSQLSRLEALHSGPPIHKNSNRPFHEGASISAIPQYRSSSFSKCHGRLPATSLVSPFFLFLPAGWYSIYIPVNQSTDLASAMRTCNCPRLNGHFTPVFNLSEYTLVGYFLCCVSS